MPYIPPIPSFASLIFRNMVIKLIQSALQSCHHKFIVVDNLVGLSWRVKANAKRVLSAID